MRKFKLITVILAICVAITGLAACTKVDVSEVMTVNGTKVTGGEFRFYLEMMKVSFSGGASDSFDWSQDMGDGTTYLDYTKQYAYDSIVSNKVMAAEAKKMGITVSDDELSAYKKSFVNSYFGTLNKDEMLKKCEISEEVLDSIISDFVYAEKYSNSMYSEEALAAITEDEIRAKYDASVEEAAAEEANGKVRAKHILVNFEKEDGTVRTEEEALAEAQRIKSEITADNFDELMAQYSEDPGSQSQPEGYTFYHGDGQYVTEFDDGAYALEIGGVSEPIKTSYGYHIIKRVPLVDSFETESMQTSLKNEVVAEKINKIVDEAQVVKNDKNYGKIK